MIEQRQATLQEYVDADVKKVSVVIAKAFEHQPDCDSLEHAATTFFKARQACRSHSLYGKIIGHTKRTLHVLSKHNAGVLQKEDDNASCSSNEAGQTEGSHARSPRRRLQSRSSCRCDSQIM